MTMTGSEPDWRFTVKDGSFHYQGVHAGCGGARVRAHAQEGPRLLPQGRRVQPEPLDVLAGWLEELERIGVGILELDLSASWARFHVISEMEPGFPQRLDTGGQIGYAKDDPIPASRFPIS